MITHKPAANPGDKPFWEVTDPTGNVIETFVSANRMNATVTTTGPRGVRKGEFAKGDPVAILLPPGAWRFESSGDGVIYHTETTLDGGGYVNLTLDGSTFPARWGRYTKIIPLPLR